MKLILAMAALVAGSAHAAEPDALVKAYPEQLAGIEGDSLVFRDGTKMPLGGDPAARSFKDKLSSATLRDQMSIAYPVGPFSPPKSAEDDPGRFRNIAFFDKLYGDCSKGEAQKNLVTISWMPKSWGKPVQVSRVNGVAEKLKAISDEIEALPPEIRKSAYPSAGTFVCRVVADTGVRSAHAYGIAIDLNTAISDYWLWTGGKDRTKVAPYRNRMPLEIVAIFEKHGFIWGGKWGHFDTMHFEYRPELLR